jgi:hypothetical protein
MSLQLRLFGGGQTAAGKFSATNDGNHAIDKSKVLASTDTSVITPLNPGNFSSILCDPPIDRSITKGLEYIKLAGVFYYGARMLPHNIGIPYLYPLLQFHLIRISHHNHRF